MTVIADMPSLMKRLRPFRKPSTLYHYTSGIGLIGVLTSRCIWATSIRFLNDSREYDLAVDLIRKSIQDRLQNVRSRFDEALYRVLEQNIDRRTTADVYVSSFSENPDQLSQWRAYCPPTGGYAIGFSGKSLATTVSSSEDRFLAKCIYEQSAQQEVIEDLICAIEATAEKSRRSGLAPDRVYRESYKLLGRLLPLAAPILKDPSFREEEEWRLVCLGSSFADTLLRFRMGPSTLVPYFEHSIAVEKGASPITDVVIGPTPHPELACEAVQALLASRGAQSAASRASLIPYRAW
jgi:Protein of unknown function (DUF2971)